MIRNDTKIRENAVISSVKSFRQPKSIDEIHLFRSGDSCSVYPRCCLPLEREQQRFFVTAVVKPWTGLPSVELSLF